MKKIICSLIVLMTVLSLTTGIYATPKEEIKLTQKEVSKILDGLDKNGSPIIKKPEDLNFSTISNTIVISGKGKEKEKVSIELYYKTNDDYIFDKQPIDVTLGSLGVFSKELSIRESFGSTNKEVFILVKIQRKSELVIDARRVIYSDIEEIKKSLENIRKP